MKSALGAVLGILIILAMFANVAFAEPKSLEYKIKKIPIKNFRDLKEPEDDRTIRITQITKSRMLSVLYIVTVEVCAGREKIYSPELEIRSDRDVIRVKLAGLIMPTTCKSSDFFILANNPDSISVSLYSRR